MAKDFTKSRVIVVFSITAALSCNQQPVNQKNTSATDKNSEKPSLEQIYQMASDNNAGCISLADSMLTSTSDPNTRAEAFYIKGLYYSNIKNISFAEQYFDSTIKENFTFYDAYIEKGILLNEKGEFEKALQTLQIALEITKNNADLYYWIGRSLEGLKKISEARDYYKMTLKLDPTYQAAEEAIKRTNY